MPSFATRKELAGLGGLFNRFVAAPFTGVTLFNQGRSGSLLDQGLRSIPSTRNTDAGRAAGNELRYMGKELLGGRIPYSKPLNAIETGKYGPTDWNPSANPRRVPTAPVLSSGAADRAYQSAKAETAAMVATDPLMQQWSAAQKTKDFATADQLGKQIWQNRYGGGLMGQPGGAIGSRNPLMERTFGYQTGMSPGDIAQTITNPAAVPVGPGEAPYQTGDLGTGALGEAGYDPIRYGVDVEEIKKRLLQQTAAK
jgi:hypothetical protein